MLKKEIGKLKTIKTNELLVHLLLCVALILSSYYFDGAVIFSFGIIPFCFIYMYRKELNINFKNTPILHFLSIGLILIFFVIAFTLTYLKHTA